VARPKNASLSTIYFNTVDIVDIVSHLKVTSSPDPDSSPPILLKSLIHQLCYPLSILFSLIFQSGYLPYMWKTALVKPI